MSFEYKSIYIIMIPTGNNKNRKWVNGEENLPPSSTPSHPFLLCLFWLIILSIRSEEVLLFLVLLIHINTHKRIEMNVTGFCFS